MLPRITFALIALALSLPGQDVPGPSGRPPHDDGPGGDDCLMCQAARMQFPPAVDKPQISIEHERQANQRAFDEIYLRQKEQLFAKYAGDWIVIAGGELLPRNAKGGVQPAAKLADALLAADEAHKTAVQRFVFRIGEEGDVRYFPTINSHPEWIGQSFFPSFNGTLWTTPDGVYIKPRGAQPDKATRIGSGIAEESGPRAEMKVSSGSSSREVALSFVVSTGFGGCAIMSHAHARDLQLARFEIPGGLYLDGVKTPLLRARAHFSIDGGLLDAWITLGVRPAVPATPR